MSFVEGAKLYFNWFILTGADAPLVPTNFRGFIMALSREDVEKLKTLGDSLISLTNIQDRQNVLSSSFPGVSSEVDSNLVSFLEGYIREKDPNVMQSLESIFYNLRGDDDFGYLEKYSLDPEI